MHKESNHSFIVAKQTNRELTHRGFRRGFSPTDLAVDTINPQHPNDEYDLRSQIFQNWLNTPLNAALLFSVGRDKMTRIS